MFCVENAIAELLAAEPDGVDFLCGDMNMVPMDCLVLMKSMLPVLRRGSGVLCFTWKFPKRSPDVLARNWFPDLHAAVARMFPDFNAPQVHYLLSNKLFERTVVLTQKQPQPQRVD